MDSARALIARGWGVSFVSRCLRVSRAQLHVILRRTDDWKEGRRSRHTDDTDVLRRIHHVIGELPTYGYRRVSGPTLQVLRTRQSPDGCEDGSYYYLVDMQRKTVQPLMNALCIADNIKLEYQEVTDPYTKEKYFEYAHDGKLMGQLLIPSNPDNQE
ncbi:hypothetical protein VEE46_34210 [Escherichia coli]|nr:hypothetical protein VEE46_34210 [Escherichia coli]